MRYAVFYSVLALFCIGCQTLPRFDSPVYLYVGTFKNKSQHKEFSSELKYALQSRLQSSGNYIVAPNINKADCRIYGTIDFFSHGDQVRLPSKSTSKGFLTAVVEFKLRKTSGQRCEILQIMGVSEVVSVQGESFFNEKRSSAALAGNLASRIVKEITLKHAETYPGTILAD